jgi:solute carrier family 45 protein 1/2/4
MKDRDNRPSPIQTPQRRLSYDQENGDDKPAKSVAFDGEMPDEQSPLLHSQSSDGEVSPIKTVSELGSIGEDWEDGSSQETKSAWYMFLLTVAGFGLQMGWSVEMSNGSPYLLSLGLSKTVLAFVWIAGPLSGVLAQPYVGIKSDRSQNRWGKRRPYLVGGTVATVISLMMLAWARSIVGGFLSLFGVAKDSNGTATCIMIFAVIFIYVLDFAINVLQAALRAFIVDCAPLHQQDSANAWVSRMNGIGNIFGMFCGGVNLPKVLPFLGNTQFKVLCAVASISMLVTTAASATIHERDPRLDGAPLRDQGLLALFADLWRSVTRLPTQIMRVCQVQFMAWIGWFPFLFYTTTYIAEMYVDPIFQENPNLSQDEIDELWEKGTRRGTLALLIYSIVTFVASVVLPWIIVPTYQAPIILNKPGTPLTPTTENALSSSSSYFNMKQPSHSPHWMHKLHTTTDALIARCRIPGLTLRRAWLLSHIMFGICMLLTFFVRGVFMATLLVGLLGLPWAITCWAPFALIASEISKRDAIRRGLIRPPPTQDGELLAANEDDSADQAGVVLGIHNVAVSAPQVIATLVSSVIFKVLSKPRGTPGDESVAWCMRFGGVCALVAAWLTMRVGEDTEGLREQDARGAEDGRRLLSNQQEM